MATTPMREPADFELFVPYVVLGGVVAFHDSTDGGDVMRVVQEGFSRDEFSKIQVIDSITVGRKGVGAKSVTDRLLLLLHRHYRLLARIGPLRRMKGVAKRLVARI